MLFCSVLASAASRQDNPEFETDGEFMLRGDGLLAVRSLPLLSHFFCDLSSIESNRT